MKTAMIEILLNSGLNFELPNHGGKIIRGVTINAICKDLSNIHTAYLQPTRHNPDEVEKLIIDTVNARDLDKLVDIWKELVWSDPTTIHIWANRIKSNLSLMGWFVGAPYLEYDDLYCKGNEHTYGTLHQFEQAYKLAYSELIRDDYSAQFRNVEVARFISILLANPGHQKKALQNCLSGIVVARHLDPMTSRERLLALRKHLLDMVSGVEQTEPEQPKVPELKLIDESRYVDPLDIKPYLFFTGTQHLTAKPRHHGTLSEEVSVLLGIMNDKASPKRSRVDDCIAYLHRSDNQQGLVASFLRDKGMEELEKIHDNRKRAEYVEEQLISIMNTGALTYADPKRNVNEEKLTMHMNPGQGKASTFAQALNKLLDPNNKDHNTSEADQLLEQLKANKFLTGNALIDNLFSNTCQNPKALSLLDGILNQIEYGRKNPTSQGGSTPMNKFGWSQGSANEEAAPQKVLITGGDPALRAQLGAMFQKDGIPFEFTDAVPEVQSEAIIYKAGIGDTTWVMEAFPLSGQLIVTPHVSSGRLESLYGKLQQDQSFDSVWNEIKKGAQCQHPFRYISCLPSFSKL